MIRWLRVTWPPGWALALAALCWVSFDAGSLLLERGLGIPYHSLDIREGALAVAGLFAAFYATFRVAAFHPAFRLGYRKWLCETPWSSRKPLPLGPIHLVLQDVLLLGIMIGLAWPRLEMQALHVIAVFLVVYLLLLTAANFATGERGCAYGFLFWFGVMILLQSDPFASMVAAVAGYCLVLLGLRASLSRFPWGDYGQAVTDYAANAINRTLGWPYEQLGPPCADSIKLRLRDTLMIGALAGWLVYAISAHFHATGHFAIEIATAVYFYFLVACVALRLYRYCVGYYPPISLLGRFATGRLIIPGYDQALVAPLLALIVGLGAMSAVLGHDSTPIDSVYVIPIALTLTWWITVGMGPSLEVWRLTGNHRIAPVLVKQINVNAKAHLTQ